MKLKNKKTGEIGKILKQLSEDNQIDVITDTKLYAVKSLAELNDEWEYYEEPKDKDFWFFDEEGIIRDTKEENWPEESVAAAKEIGNYFETYEEAEKAVEKLKAWKRLRDKGFRSVEYRNTLANVGCPYRFIIEASVDACEKADLDLLFGGEE